MILLNWLPEIVLMGCLFISLVFVNFRIQSFRALAPFLAGVIAVMMTYFVIRTDLAFFESPLAVLYSDSLSYFGRLLSLCSLAVFSLSFYFHERLSVNEKQTAMLFLIFQSLFISTLFQANNVILFLGAGLGIYSCSTNLILIESKKDQAWIRLIRQRTVMIGIWAVVISILFVLAAHQFGSVLISDWISNLSKFTGSEIGIGIMVFLVLLGSVIPLEGMLHSGRSPVGLGVLYFGMFLILQVYWLRIGVPFLSTNGLVNKPNAQLMASLLLGAFTLRFAIQAVRVRDHHRWFAAALPVILGLSLFLCLLPADKVLPVFYCVSLSMLFTFALISQAFMDEKRGHRAFMVVSLIAIMGVPPLILGDQIFRMIRDIVLGGNWVAGVLMIISWFGLVVAVMQMLGKVLLVRNGIHHQRRMGTGEIFFLALYAACVIALTAFRPGLIALLNEHPILNLW